MEKRCFSIGQRREVIKVKARLVCRPQGDVPHGRGRAQGPFGKFDFSSTP